MKITKGTPRLLCNCSISECICLKIKLTPPHKINFHTYNNNKKITTKCHNPKEKKFTKDPPSQSPHSKQNPFLKRGTGRKPK